MRIFPNFIFNQIIPLIRILSAAQSRSCHLEGDSIKIDIPIWRAVKGLRIFCGWESTMPPHRSPRCYTHNGASSLLYTVSATLRALHITLYQINSAGICMTQWILKGKWQVRRTGSKFSIPCIDKSLNPLLRLARSMYNTTLFFFPTWRFLLFSLFAESRIFAIKYISSFCPAFCRGFANSDGRRGWIGVNMKFLGVDGARYLIRFDRG